MYVYQLIIQIKKMNALACIWFQFVNYFSSVGLVLYAVIWFGI